MKNENQLRFFEGKGVILNRFSRKRKHKKNLYGTISNHFTYPQNYIYVTSWNIFTLHAPFSTKD